MKILDKIVLNRLISILTNFILGLMKIFNPKVLDDIELPKPDKRIFPRWRKKK